jgi:FkbM family methyltransferase
LSRSPALAARRVRQTLTFANGPRVLADLGSSLTPWRRDELRFRTRDGLEVICPNHAGARVPVYEVFAEDAYRLDELLMGLPERPVVLDIGAQIGCFSLAVAAHLPQAVVHAYEASPSTARWLERNVRGNRLIDRVTPHAVAVSDHDGTLDLADNVHGSALNGLTSPGGSTVSVPCRTFAAVVDAAGGHVDLVKLDTEGAEYAIVLGSSAADWATVRRVVMEYHDVPGHAWSELEAFFGAAGLDVVRHEPASPRQGTVWLRRTGA